MSLNDELEIIEFCSIECSLQMSGEKSVSWMLNAWAHAQIISAPLVIDDIVILGQLVEPLKNAEGFRRCNVRVGASIKPDWSRVPILMAEFLHSEDWAHEDPAEWFRTYEEIHPFVDGNGRTGVILFNLLNGTLDKPVWPPNFWDDPRRTPGYGAA